MPKVLEPTATDVEQDKLDEVMTKAEEEAAARIGRDNSNQQTQDLTDGGSVNGATIYPTQGHVRQEMGRAVARRAWMWNGTESLLPLGWNPAGTMHNGARPYLLKRQCMCCMTGGFRGMQCPQCVKRNCIRCKSSTDPKKIIALFYLRKEDVPFPARFYGSIDCFLEYCPRRGDRGFMTEQDMRVHARTRHRMEYQAHTEALAAAHTDDLDSLRRRIDDLTRKQLQTRGTRGRKAKV